VAPLLTDHPVLRVSPPPSLTPPPPPPRHKEQLVPLGLQGQWSGRGGGGGGGGRGGGGRGRGVVRGGRIRAQIFEDPAVVRTVEGRPSLKVIRTLSSVLASDQHFFLSFRFNTK